MRLPAKRRFWRSTPGACCSSRATPTSGLSTSSPARSSCARTTKPLESCAPEAPRPAPRLRPVCRGNSRARALTDIEYIVIDSDLLDVLLTWDQTGQYEVAELRGDGMDVSGRLDDHAAADQGVSPHSSREHPGHLHADAADQLPGARHRHQARDRGRLLLRSGRRKMPGDPRDALEQGRHQAGRTRTRRQLRRGGPDRRGQAQRHGDHGDRRHLDAPRQARFPDAAQRTAAAMGRLRRRARRSSPRAESGWMCGCPANSRISASTRRSTSRCTSSA